MSKNEDYARRLLEMTEGRASPENPNTSLADPAAWLVDWANGGGPTPAGPHVSAETMMRLAAVYSCVRLLSESVASLPLFVYERLGGGGKRKATDYPLYPLLHDAVNPELLSFLFREVSMQHLLLRGNAYAEIQRTGGGAVAGLFPIHAAAVTPKRAPDGVGRLYDVRLADGGSRTLGPDRILHIPGVGFDGLKGTGVITYARNSLGLTTAAEEFGARFLANGVRASGVLEYPELMSDTAYGRLRDSFAASYAGSANSGKPVVLEEGAKWSSISISPDEAQYLETRQFQIPEICRWFRVPPHLVYDLSKATFSNIEHQSIEFVTHSLRHWLVRWEASLTMALIPAADRDKYFIEFNVDGLLRGDLKTRYEAYAIGKQWGFVNTNMINEMENRSPVEGGDVFFAPMNMVPADKLVALADSVIAKNAAAKPGDAGSPGTPGEGRGAAAAVAPTREVVDQIRTAYKPVFADALVRVTRREVDVLTRAAKRGDYRQAVTALYDGHAEYVRNTLRAAVEAFTGAMRAVGADAAMDLDAIAAAHCAERRGQAEAGSIEQLAAAWQTENDALAESMIDVLPTHPAAAA